jgi:acyl transferase domain-containing protein/acyl carrier protein
MDPDLAITAMSQALDHDETCLAVADIDWERFVSLFTMARPSRLLAELAEARRAHEGGADASVSAELRERLLALPASEQREAMLSLVLSQMAVVLGHESAHSIDPHRPFRDLGLDSIGAIELRNRLMEATGLRLPATLVFDQPSPLTLAAQLYGECTNQGSEHAPIMAAVAPRNDDPIAIVGMSCRLPGGVTSPAEFWQIIADGRDVVSELPADRGWDSQYLSFSTVCEAVNMDVLRQGGFIANATEFDAAFFGISADEALAMDPQQRLLLEMAWEAIERAGIDPQALRRSPVGVFIGTFSNSDALNAWRMPEGAAPYFPAGRSPAVASGRISYTLGLEGPAFTVDTGCSSSAVAMHLACQAVHQGECTQALVGGISVLAHPYVASFRSGTATDGRCRSFAEAAAGTGWGEGGGMLLIERLSDARRLGHPVLAVVRGSAMNHSGETNGLGAPNRFAQQHLILQALANAGLRSDEVDAVEAHGTGTPMGDPVEAEALLATYGKGRPSEYPLWLGTVKSNIGHPQAASGVIGVIKMVMAIQAGLLPKTLHVDEPSSLVEWSAGDVSLLTQARPWPELGRPRRAGVSSFGGSGTQVHLILEQAPAPGDGACQTSQVGAGSYEESAVPIPVSARSEAGLRGQARRLLDFVRSHTDVEPADVCRATSARSVFEHRALVLAADRHELLVGLSALSNGEAVASLVTGVELPGARVAVVCSEKNRDHLQATRALSEWSPAFAKEFDEACAVLQGHIDRPLQATESLDALDTNTTSTDSCVREALVLAGEVAFCRFLELLGVFPSAIVADSGAHIAAACAAGMITLDDAGMLLAKKRRVLSQAAERGTPIDLAEEQLKEDFRRTVQQISVKNPRTRLFSTAVGEVSADGELLLVDLWTRDVGDEPPAKDPVGDLAGQIAGPWISLDLGAVKSANDMLGQLAIAHVSGTTVNWGQLFPTDSQRLVELPTYAFQRERFALQS